MRHIQTPSLAQRLLLVSTFMFGSAHAAEFCHDQYYIDTTLPNEARWDMCWEHRAREGVVLHHIHYTPPNGPRRMVLYQAAIAQIHVPYDDNGARYHDVSDYGLGNRYIKSLRSAECKGGQLLQFSGKNIICKQESSRDDAYSAGDDRLQGDALSLFSVSAIGAYNYIPEWRFLDDGSIEPGMGATGALQRFGSANIAQHGWLIDNNKTGIAHLHNFFWKLDFDLGGTGSDDGVEEINYIQSDGKMRRVNQRFVKEAARDVNPNQLRSWRVFDGAIKNSKNLPISYEIQLTSSGQQDKGPSSEPFTHHDFYVTQQRNCELFASHNPTSGGCANNLAAFANGESILNKDIVVWPSATFYHMPRAEDAPRMDTHWTHFRIIPRDWHDTNPLSNAAETRVEEPPPPPPNNDVVSNNGSNLAIDGNLNDWSNLTSFGVDPNDVSGANNQLDWQEGWMANDRDNFYLAYRSKQPINTNGFWAYQIYLDTDSNSSTGYKTADLGMEYVLEGANVWRYIGDGTSWNWAYQGTMNWKISGNTAEFRFPRHLIGNPEQLRTVFWGNNAAFGGNAKDVYPDGAFDNNAAIRYFRYKMHTAGGDNPGINNPVTNINLDGQLTEWTGLTAFGTDPVDISGQNNKLDWRKGWMAHDANNAYLAYETHNAIDTNGWWGYQVYINTDPAVGYPEHGFKTEYVLEGTELWHYTGDGSSWSWEHAGSITHGVNGKTAEFRLPRGLLGNPSKLRLLFKGDNRAFNGDASDLFPNAGSNPVYVEYQF